MIFRSIAFVAAAILAGVATASACTGIRLIAQDGTVVMARTLEFGMDLQSKIVVIPAGTKLTGSLPNNAAGISYVAKHGFLGANAFGLPIIVDGLNDQGLYVGEFFFPGYAGYADVTPANASQAMAGYEYSDWILANFSTVAEVKAAYDRVALVSTIVPQMGMAPPVHFRIADRTGADVVIEPVGGKLRLYDDPLGILTNAPTFDWHLTNLSNYAGLRPMIEHPVTLSPGFTLQSFGQGSGFYGLPGDFTPPSRFVRAVAYQVTAVPATNAADAVQQAFHILNNFDIPVGAVRDVVQGKTIDEYTLWTSAIDLKNLQFYFRTFTDQSLRSVDVTKTLAAAGGQIRELPLESGQTTPIVPVAAAP